MLCFCVCCCLYDVAELRHSYIIDTKEGEFSHCMLREKFVGIDRFGFMNSRKNGMKDRKMRTKGREILESYCNRAT